MSRSRHHGCPCFVCQPPAEPPARDLRRLQEPVDLRATVGDIIDERLYDVLDGYDAAARAAEKQRARDEDYRRLAAGEITVEELRRENGVFAFPHVRLELP